MATKVIGYQITNQNQDIPVGLCSFQLFKTAEQAFNYLYEHKLNKGLPASQCWFVKFVKSTTRETLRNLHISFPTRNDIK